MASDYDPNSYDPESEGNEYFAGLKSDKLPGAVWHRFKHGQSALRSSGKHDRLQRSWRTYYARGDKGQWGDTTQIGKGGKRGELTQISPNHYRNLTQHVLSMITGAPPNRGAEAGNTDADGMQQAMLADGIVEHFAHDGGLDQRIAKALEMSLVLTESWIGGVWDPNLGDEYGVQEDVDPETGEASKRMMYAGDFRFPVLSPYEMVSEPNPDDPNRPRWAIARLAVSKHRLAALYPQHTDEIMKAPRHTSMQADFGFAESEGRYDDKIAVLHLTALRGPELISGREAMIISPETAILDDSLGYQTIPYFRLAPSDVMMDGGGYSNNMDMLPVCQAATSLTTSLLTNNTAFGTQMLSITKGSGLRVQNLGAMKALHVNPGHEIKPLQLTASAPESYTFLEMLVSMAAQFSGVSDAQRGDADAMKGDSGSKQALVASLAQQFQGPLSKAKAECEEGLFTHIIDTVKTRVQTERVASIVGRYNTAAARKWKGEDVAGISKVRVKTGSAVLGTAQQREAALDKILSLPNAGQFVNPEQLIAFWETGRIEHVTEAPMQELTLIRRENEIMGDAQELAQLGGQLMVAPTDQHKQHIHEHMTVLNDPVARVQDPQKIQAVTAHVLWHIECLTPGMPRFAGMQVLAATNQQPLPMGPAPMGPQPPQAGPKPGAKPPPKGDGGGGMPQLPSVPKSPATGQEAAPEGLPAPGNQAA